RPPNPFTCGAACVPTRARCSPGCAPNSVARRARKRSGVARGLVISWKAFCYAIGTLLVATLAVQVWYYGHVVYWNAFNPSSTAFMEQRLEQLREKNSRAVLRRQWVPYERISRNLKRAVVAAEDARFL